MSSQQQLRNLSLALRQQGFTKIVETPRQSAMQAAVARLLFLVGGPAIPDIAHRRIDDRFDQANAVQLGLRYGILLTFI